MSDPRCILGLTKYAHSTALALLDADGETRYALARERLTRKKFDGGDVAGLLEHALDQTGLRLDDIGLVIENCHLFRVAPFEQRLRFTVGQRYYAQSCLDPLNLAGHPPGLRKQEISHHLAHAYAALHTAPFEEGVIVVMDGMGSLRAGAVGDPTPEAFTERGLERAPAYREVPARATPSCEWREAESVYLFQGATLRPLFKRWTPLRSPSILHNYGFEDMESLGAVYSRISSHIFTDWNACGKVMGLAGYGRPNRAQPILSGPLESLRVHWDYLESLTPAARWDAPENRTLNEELAATVQDNLEAIVLDFLRRLHKETRARNLIVTGGVALNSQLNGRIPLDTPFANVFVPSAPGDDGVALGCAAFGRYHVQGAARTPRATVASPYLGGEYDAETIRAALDAESDRIVYTAPRDLTNDVARRLAAGKIVGWFQGRSEYGPRALGCRSILAHPGIAEMPDRLNLRVKFREPFRPYAPTVIAEEAHRFFDAPCLSPYMSFAVPVRKAQRKRLPAVTHVDGTARLQHLVRDANPLYYDLIRRFEALTGLPVILNTSFNLAGEPIVETPDDAVWSFLNSEMDALVMGPFVAVKRPFPAGKRLRRCAVQTRADALIEMVRQGDGTMASATLYIRGKGHPLDPVETAILTGCSDPVAVRCLFDAPDALGGASRTKVATALKRLYQQGALRLLPSEQAL